MLGVLQKYDIDIFTGTVYTLSVKKQTNEIIRS